MAKRSQSIRWRVQTNFDNLSDYRLSDEIDSRVSQIKEPLLKVNYFMEHYDDSATGTQHENELRGMLLNVDHVLTLCIEGNALCAELFSRSNVSGTINSRILTKVATSTQLFDQLIEQMDQCADWATKEIEYSMESRRGYRPRW